MKNSSQLENRAGGEKDRQIRSGKGEKEGERARQKGAPYIYLRHLHQGETKKLNDLATSHSH